MSRVLCSLTLSLSVAMLAFGPTVAFANSTNPPSPPFSSNNSQGGNDKSGSCNNNPGCTDVKKNPAGNNCTCSGPDHKCATAC